MAQRVRPSQRRAAPVRGQQLTLDAIVAKACAILDAGGMSALTLRALAASLDVGVASLYWYVDNRDDLLEQCLHASTDAAIEPLLAIPIDPTCWREGMRALCLGFFRVVAAHPWLVELLSADMRMDAASMLLWDRLGATLLRLGLPMTAAYSAATTLLSHIGAMAAAAAQGAYREAGGAPARQQRLDQRADAMAGLDGAEFSFVQASADILRTHTEEDQLLSGLDLIMDGIATHLPAPPAHRRDLSGEGPVR
jgi:AcrR family transcriptional regulator